MRRISVHFGWFTKEEREWQINRILLKQPVTQSQMLIVGRLPHNGMRATLALTHGFKNLKILGINGHDVTLLRLVTPNFEGTHTLFITRDVT